MVAAEVTNAEVAYVKKKRAKDRRKTPTATITLTVIMVCIAENPSNGHMLLNARL